MPGDGHLAGSSPETQASGGVPLALCADFERMWGGLLPVLRMSANTSLSGPMPWIWLIPAVPVVFGATQHVMFSRSMAKRGGAPHA